jgi:hypothetical protein
MATALTLPVAAQLQLPDVAAGAILSIANQIQGGTVTLVAGTKTVSAGITITANSRIIVNRTVQGGTSTAVAEYDVTTQTVGAPGTGAFTVQASTVAGTIVNTDTSTLAYIIIG